VKSRRILNQQTYKSRLYKFSRHNYILHKVRKIIEIHRSLKHKVITNQVHNKVAEANSLRLHTHPHVVQIIVPANSHVQQKHQVRRMERPCP
jgi:hypothetical protein